jgi:LysR family hydrogen peroxide-inducible transcriptional activator
MRLPTLRQLQYFIAVAETLSVSRAADNCHITQSTLSASLAELEDVLGEKLFDRGTRHLNLTQVGTDLLPSARTIIEQSENLVRMASRHRDPLSGKLALGVIPTIAPYLLPQLLPALQTEFPSLDLMQLDDLKNGKIDVVLMAFPYDTPSALDTLMLWKEPFFVARAGDQLSRSDTMSIDDLQQEKILLLDDGHCLRDHIISACRLTSSSKTSKTLGATSLQTLIQMVQHGYGTTLLPAMAIQPDQMPKGICIQRFSNPQPTRQIGIVWRKNDPRAGEFALLGGFIKKTAAPKK